LTGCSSPDNAPAAPNPTTTPTPTPTATGGDTTTSSRILLAYFSRPGENYYYGGRRNLEVGNTEVLARMIAELIDCNVHRIEATDPYPASYDATVARNVQEQTPTPDRRSPTRWPRSSSTTPCCWAAQSGTSDPR
jgi:hypothetical protein